MDFLSLVNMLREETGASGAELVSLGGTLSTSTRRQKNWINRAWRWIQSKHRTWLFMEKAFSFQTVAGTQTYTAATLSTPITNLANWKRSTMRCYRTSIGVGDEQILPFLDWLTFRDLYMFSTQGQVQQRPVVFSIDPNKQIVLGPIPEDIYTIAGYYYKSPQTLVADSDEPDVDEEFHELVVYEAMRKYAMFEAAPEVLARANEEADELLAKLEMDYLPQITMGAALA
jgi:hypothetical protein